jgi:hypothetical protein
VAIYVDTSELDEIIKIFEYQAEHLVPEAVAEGKQAALDRADRLLHPENYRSVKRATKRRRRKRRGRVRKRLEAVKRRRKGKPGRPSKRRMTAFLRRTKRKVERAPEAAMARYQAFWIEIKMYYKLLKFFNIGEAM